MNKSAAFFDLDGTIFRMVTTLEIFKEAVRLGHISQEIWDVHLKDKLSVWENREGPMNDFIRELGIHYREFVSSNPELNKNLTALVLEKQLHRLNVFTNNEIKRLKSLDIPCYIISDADQSVVDFVVENLGLTGGFGSTNYKDANGVLISKRLKKQQKADKLLEIVKKNDFDLDSCFAYGDTHIDFEMLELVGFPHIINPIKELIEKVMISENKSRYNLIIEKKGVVYQIKLPKESSFLTFQFI